MTAQEIFDKAVGGLLNQGVQSYSEELSKCVYRTACGSKCAVGQLIPDNLYQPDMESGPSGVDSLVEKFPQVGEYILPSNMSSRRGMSFLSEMQEIHDHCEDAWEARFKEMAAGWSLQWNFN